MRSQELRLRRKRSHMPCNLVNFIFSEMGIGGWVGTAAGEKTRQKKKKRVKSEKPQRVRKTSAGGWDQLPPPRIRPRPAMSSRLSLCAGVEAPARAEPSNDAARRRARESERSEEHLLPFYRGIRACTEQMRVHAVRAMHAARLNKSALACATLCASVFLQVVVAVFSEASKR